MKRKLKNDTYSIVITEDYTYEMAIEEYYIKKMQSGFCNWYPAQWYTFLAMGLPSGDSSPLLISGCPTKNVALALGPSRAREEGGRQARRLEARLMTNVNNAPSSGDTPLKRYRMTKNR